MICFCPSYLHILDTTNSYFIFYNLYIHIFTLHFSDMFLPCPDNLLVNLNECHELIRDLLSDLPTKYNDSYDTGSALGAALQAAYKLLVSLSS